MNEPAWLICVPVAEMVGNPAEGSVQLMCEGCGAALWVARSSQQMLASGETYMLLCMHCATNLSEGSPVDTAPENPLQQVERLKARAEAAYDKMYDLHDERAIKWEYETAYDSLRDAARAAREAGLDDEADACEKRAQHIRLVFRHQFMMPPDLPM
ncbi:MAG TPA: hypothetical protein VG225_07545 [Terracidiphilus sp.]|nr:hypothetical protein [Terracidiphilus sp.]